MRAHIRPPTKKLTAVTFANCLNEKTGQLNPSIQMIADTVGISRCQAQRTVRDLIKEGVLSVLANRLGGKPGVTPHYRLHLERVLELYKAPLRYAPNDGVERTAAHETDIVGEAPTDSADAAPSGNPVDSTTDVFDATPTDLMDAAPALGLFDEEGSHGCAGGVAPMHERGSAGATQTGKNRKGTGKKRASRSSLPEVTFAAWLAGLEAVGEDAIPAADPIFDYAERIGLPADFLRLAWNVFKTEHLPRDDKLQQDWRATFRVYIRNDYLKLWYIDDRTGEYRLKLKGQQAQREEEAVHG